MERNAIIFVTSEMKHSSPPLVSVFMPVYNAGIYLEQAIQSILDQTFRDFEFVIVNDGSTDNSESVILSISDPRIRLENNPQNLGLIASLNRGLELCTGKYIVRMDQDDISLPTRLEKQIGWLEANPDYGLIGSWFEDFGDEIESRIVQYSSDDTTIRIRHLYQTHISHPTAVLRTSVIREHQIRFDPEFVHGEDYNCWVSFSEHSKLSNYPEVLVRKRDHPRNITNLYAQTMHDTCTRVKQRQFAAMGASVTEEEADLYTRFADPEWTFSADEMENLLKLLNRMHAANEKSSFINPKSLDQYLAEKWFHLCYHNAHIRKDSAYWWKRADFYKAYHPKPLAALRMSLRGAGIPA